MNEQEADRAFALKLARRRGMSEARRAEVNQALAKATDCWAICRHCGEHLSGTMSQITAHSCVKHDQ